VVKRRRMRTGVMVAVEGHSGEGPGVYSKRHRPSRVVRDRRQSGSCCQRRYCFPPRAVRAARPGGACHRGVGRGREREDAAAAAVVDRRGGLTERAAWVSVLPEERDAQRFWLSVAGRAAGTHHRRGSSGHGSVLAAGPDRYLPPVRALLMLALPLPAPRPSKDFGPAFRGRRSPIFPGPRCLRPRVRPG